MNYKKNIWYPWLEDIYNQILCSYYFHKGHQALLLNSKYNNGENALVYRIVCWLLCTSSSKDMQCCNVCHSCCLLDLGNHPDFYQIGCDNNIKFIGIESIRECVDSIYKCNAFNLIKVIFIKHVEYLTSEAVNMLLKILEEPPMNTYFFLKTQEYLFLPKTLLSRCIKWSISTPIESLGLTWLIQQQKKEETLNDKKNILINKVALRLNYGSPIEAEFMLKSNLWKNRVELCSIISSSIKDKDFLRILNPLLIEKKYIVFSVYWLITLLLDALKWKYKIREKFIINLDQLKLIALISITWDRLSLYNQLKQWLILFFYFQKFDSINHELLLVYRLLNWQKNIVEPYLQSWSI